MPHPTYYVGDKKPSNRVPSVTTVLRNWGDKGGLIYWAHQQGAEGISLQEARVKACDAGTVAHSMIEQDLRGRVPRAELPEDYRGDPDGEETKVIVAAAEAGFRGFQTWKSGLSLSYLETELSLVHPEHRYGGTIDCVALVEYMGKEALAIPDWKCANGTYPEHVYQLAAYRDLWEYHHPDKPVEYCFSCRFGKPGEGHSGGDFHQHGFTREQMDIALDAFLAILKAYKLEAAVKRWVR